MGPTLQCGPYCAGVCYFSGLVFEEGGPHIAAAMQLLQKCSYIVVLALSMHVAVLVYAS